MDTVGYQVLIVVAIMVIMIILEYARRQRFLARRYRIEIDAWQQAQDRVREGHERTYEATLQIQRESQEQYARSTERNLAIQESRLKVAEGQLEELRRMNAQSLSKNCSGSLRPLFLWGRRTLPHAGRDTRPPSPRRLMGAGRLR